MVRNDRVNEGCRMSVLIKDIKMPESCLDCPIYDNYNYQCNLYGYGIPARYNYDPSKRPEWCELEELPEHHGRLADADRLMRVYEDRLEKVADRYGVDSSEAGILSGAMKLLMIEPTIIEEE